LLLVIMRVAIGSKVDVLLRPLQRAEIFPQVFRIGIAMDHGRDHEGAIDDLPETKLFGEVIGPAEERRRRHLAVDEKLHATEEKPVLEGELDLIALQELLERLDGRVMAPRAVADRYGYAGEIGRRLHR